METVGKGGIENDRVWNLSKNGRYGNFSHFDQLCTGYWAANDLLRESFGNYLLGNAM